MELIKSVRKRGLLSSVLHILFNLVYVAVVLMLVRIFDAPWAAMTLTVISKWRVFAVRPRYWLVNALSNLTDFLFGLGIVALMWVVGDAMAIQIGLSVMYAAWLILLKPMHRHIWVVLQAGISQFVAISALFVVAHLIPLPIVVLFCFAIGFASVRHVFSSHSEEQATLLAMVWGLIVAELGFVAYHWTIGYPIIGSLEIPQIAIIVTALAFVVERSYSSYIHHEKVRWQDVQWPIIFATVLIGMLLFFFSGLGSAAQL